MANPHVRFTFKTDGKTQLATSGNGSLRDVVAAVHGAELAGKMVEVGSWAGPYPVWGLTSSPEHSRANRTGISMFINSRWVFSRTISVALEDAYRGLLMEGRFPLAAIFVDVPPPEVDVNVHPQQARSAAAARRRRLLERAARGERRAARRIPRGRRGRIALAGAADRDAFRLASL